MIFYMLGSNSGPSSDLSYLSLSVFHTCVVEGSVRDMGRKFEDSPLWLFPIHGSTTMFVVSGFLTSVFNFPWLEQL